MTVIKAVRVPNIGQSILQGIGAYSQLKQTQREDKKVLLLEEKIKMDKLSKKLALKAQTDPKALQQLVALNPKMASDIQNFQLAGKQENRSQLKFQADIDKESNERFNKERAYTSDLIINRPLSEQVSILDTRLGYLKRNNLDPSHTQRLVNMLSSGDPAQIAQGQMAIEAANEQGYQKGYLKPGTTLSQNIDLLHDPSLSKTDKEIVYGNLMGSQFSVTTPEGLVIKSGRRKKEDPTGLGRSAKNVIQKEMTEMKRDLNEFKVIRNRYNKDFLTLKGGIKSSYIKAKSYLNFGSTAEEVSFTKKRRKFTQPVQNLFNRWLNRYAGVRVIRNELTRQKEATLNPKLSPIEFEAALDESEAMTKRGLRVYNQILSEGLSPNMNNIKTKKRAAELWEAGGIGDVEGRISILEAEGKTEDEIYDTLMEEGYTF